MSTRLKAFVRSASKRLVAAIAGELGREELLILIGLLLVSYGCWHVWRPASFIVPGLTLLWIALPSRVPFVDRPERRRTE